MRTRTARTVGRTRLLVALVAALALSACAGAPSDGRSTTAGEDEARSCLTGTLGYRAADAESQETRSAPARSSDWELRAASRTGGKADLIDSGTVDDRGRFSACGSGELHGASLRFTAERAGLWRVVEPGGSAPYAFDTEPQDAVSGTTDLGTVEVPEELASAWKIVDTATDLYALRGTDSVCWTAQSTTADDCAEVTYEWPAKNPDDAGFWDSETDRILLAGTDPASRHLVLHETGHWWQNQLYGGRFPEVTDCSPHYIDRPSSRSCAWTEGFADAVAAWVLGDRRYVGADGEATAFEASDGAPWPGGDRTQGNVGASLLDLWALDGPDDSWDANIALMTGSPSADFRAYFDELRPTAGLPITGEAARILARHGIDSGGSAAE